MKDRNGEPMGRYIQVGETDAAHAERHIATAANYPTVLALLVPCGECALVDVLTFPGTDPSTVRCRECIVEALVATMLEVTQ